MQPLSATEAISPAWSHTRNLLIAPRRFGLLFKITLIACLTMAGQGLSYSFSQPHHAAGVPQQLAVMMLAVHIVMSLVALCVAVVLFYVGSRFQFVLFDVVLRGDTVVGPIWRRFGRVTWKWIGLKLFLIVPLLLLMIPFGIQLANYSQGAFPPGTMPSWPVVVHFFAGLLRIFLELLAVGTIFAVLLGLAQDFALPSIAMENTPLRETVRRVTRLVRAEPGPVAAYVLLRMLIMFAGALAAQLIAFVAAAIALVPFGAVVYLLYKILARGTVSGGLLFGLAAGLLGVIYLAVFFCLFIIAVGYVYVFLQAYALFFLGGRYPRVGEYMERFLPLPVPPLLPSWQPGLYSRPPA